MSFVVVINRLAALKSRLRVKVGSHLPNSGNSPSARIANGGIGISTSDSEVFSEHEWVELVDRLALSPRQAQVIQRVLSGRSDKQIARDLQMAVPTVRTHLSRAFSRFGVQDRTELVLHVFRQFRVNCH